MARSKTIIQRAFAGSKEAAWKPSIRAAPASRGKKAYACLKRLLLIAANAHRDTQSKADAVRDKSKVVEFIHGMEVLFHIALNAGNRYDIRANEDKTK